MTTELENKINSLLEEINQISSDYSWNDYGLPLHNETEVIKMRSVVTKFLDEYRNLLIK
jgi:hypothetical protein